MKIICKTWGDNVSIMWFKQAARGRGSAGADKTFRITFTDRPKGVRLNAAFTKHLVAEEVQFLQIGVEDDVLLIKPIAERKDSFKLIVNKNSGQVCSTAIGLGCCAGILNRGQLVFGTKNRTLQFQLTPLLQRQEEEPSILAATAGSLDINNISPCSWGARRSEMHNKEPKEAAHAIPSALLLVDS